MVPPLFLWWRRTGAVRKWFILSFPGSSALCLWQKVDASVSCELTKIPLTFTHSMEQEHQHCMLLCEQNTPVTHVYFFSPLTADFASKIRCIPAPGNPSSKAAPSVLLLSVSFLQKIVCKLFDSKARHGSKCQEEWMGVRRIGCFEPVDLVEVDHSTNSSAVCLGERGLRSRGARTC